MYNYQGYDRQTIQSIGVGLTQYNSASDLAKALNIDVSGLIKHIKKHRYLKESASRNKCGIKNSCHIIDFFEKKPCMKYRKDPNECKYCFAINCNPSCPLFTPLPKCERLNKFPYTYDGCQDILGCHISHYFYDVENIWKNILNMRSTSRVGCHADEKEFVRLSRLLVPSIKEKHHRLPQIFQSHKDEIRWSYPTVLKFIDLGLIPNRERKTCENDDLPLDVIDIIALKVVNKIITNKKNYFDLLEESFNSKNDVEKKKKEIQELQEKIDVLQVKFKKYKDIDEEFYREVNKAYKEKLKPLYMKKVALENSISTATSVNDYLYQFKKVLSPYDRTISSLIDFPLNKIFSRVIIHDRDHITFVLGEAGDISATTSMDDDILIQTEPYLIRKTKHLLKYGIYIN